MSRYLVIKENPQKKFKTIIKCCITITFYNQVCLVMENQHSNVKQNISIYITIVRFYE